MREVQRCSDQGCITAGQYQHIIPRRGFSPTLVPITSAPTVHISVSLVHRRQTATTYDTGVGWTSNTAESRSCVTLSWPFLPAFRISTILASASLLASSSAALFPCVCYCLSAPRRPSSRGGNTWASNSLYSASLLAR